MYERALAGEMPAEALPRHLRHQLLMQLHDRGLSLDEIAELTMTDSVVVARILNEQAAGGAQ
jgi:hypothetical protein